MPTPDAYNRLRADYEALRRAAIRVCVSEHPAQCADPAPEIAALWDLVGDFTDADLSPAEGDAP